MYALKGLCTEPKSRMSWEVHLVMKALSGKRVTADVRLTAAGKTYTAFGQVQFSGNVISGIPVMQLSRWAVKALKEKEEVSLEICARENRTPETQRLSHRFEVSSYNGFERAQTCSGGIGTDCIDAETLSLKHDPRIHVCGELIDIDGICGGYNLHFAFATGLRAGEHAALWG